MPVKFPLKTSMNAASPEQPEERAVEEAAEATERFLKMEW
jgi:hypothetical protein